MGPNASKSFFNFSVFSGVISHLHRKFSRKGRDILFNDITLYEFYSIEVHNFINLFTSIYSIINNCVNKKIFFLLISLSCQQGEIQAIWDFFPSDCGI